MSELKGYEGRPGGPLRSHADRILEREGLDREPGPLERICRSIELLQAAPSASQSARKSSASAFNISASSNLTDSVRKQV
jgi:hypothetical protein